MQQQLDGQMHHTQSSTEVEREEKEEARTCVRQCLEMLEQKAAFEGDVRMDNIQETLEVVQGLLEACSDVVIMNKLGSLPHRLAAPMGKMWQFPSDHPPVGATVTVNEAKPLHVASWNVLNKSYYKFIAEDTQGLNGSLISELHARESPESSDRADAREHRIADITQKMLCREHYPVSLICLQECSADFLRVLKRRLGEVGMPRFRLLQSGQDDDKNQEVGFERFAWHVI